MNNSRFITFDNVNNFRDIGGLKTHDGRMMKPGILFRSGDLSRLSASDSEKLLRLRLKLICDLRTPRERRFRRDRVRENESIRLVTVPIQHRKGSGNRRITGILMKKSRSHDFARFIKEYYLMLAFERTGQINEIVTLI